MRIVFIGPYALYPKSAVRVRILPLAKELKKKNHEVTILLPPADNPHHSGTYLKTENIDVHNVLIPKTRLPIKYLHVVGMLMKKTLELRPDIVHIFKPIGYSGLSGIFLGISKFFRLTKSSLVVDLDDWEGYGGYADYKLAYGLHSKVVVDLLDLQEKLLVRQADAVTVVSKALQSKVCELRGAYDSDHIFYVPNGPAELTATAGSKAPHEIRNSLGIEDKPVVLLWTRFLDYDLEEVIEILARVVSEMKNVRLLVMGKGFFHEEVKFLELAKEKGLIGNVIYLGWVKSQDIRGYIEASDLAIYPFKDNFMNRCRCPCKLAQLMSLGKAVVADKVGQISEYIEHERSGILVEPDDAEKFAKWVVDLLRDKKLRERLGENAKRRIYDSFGWEQLANTVELSYKLLLQRKG